MNARMCGPRWLLLSVAGIFLTAWLAAGAQSRRVDQNALKNAGKTGEDWLTYGLNYGETRYSPLKQIDTTNVNTLGSAWTFEIGPGGGVQQSTPLVSNGVLYYITNWSITFAVDARTGKELWQYNPQVDRADVGPKVCCGIVNRGLALYEGKVFVPVIDGRLVALDAAKGTVLWNVQTVPTDQPYSMTMAPRIAKNKVIVGNAGGEYPVRGYFSAYDTNTGKLVWRFYTVPKDPSKGFESKAMERAAKTWSGEWYKMGGGGTVWDAITYDPETDLVFVGTGNGGPWPAELRQSKGLDNLFVASLIAVDAENGDYKWHYQFVPGDSWDFDGAQQLVFMDLRINGRNRKVIMQANKNGFFYVIDRTNGKLISAEPFAQVNWASGIDVKTGRPMINPQARYGAEIVAIMPGSDGAHSWAPMSFNPVTGLMYIPAATSTSTNYAVQPDFVYNPGRINQGINRSSGRGGATPLPSPALPVIGPTNSAGEFFSGGWLIAWNPVTQKERWRALTGVGGGGTLTTAGNLVFQTLNNGHLVAFAADTGDQLLDVATGQTGGMGPPITYMVDGKQHVTLAGGFFIQRGTSETDSNATVRPLLYTYVLDGNVPNPSSTP